MDEEGMPEPCDAEHGKYGWLDCTYFLGVCMGEERCEIPPPLPTLALQVGADGLKVGQKTYAQMESMVAVSEGWALEGFAPVSGPSAYVESGLLIKRLDCGGAIVGMLPSHEHLQEIRALTNQIIF
jgi:hypothetical protein